jgi:hypothetical protein
MSNAIDSVRNRLLRVARALSEANVPYAVVGGNAVAAWVATIDEAAVRNTRDVDILLRRSDLTKATAALEVAGFVHRRIASLGKGGHMDVFLDGPEAKVRDAVHVLFALEKPLPESFPNADISESENTPDFRIISVEALVRMKLGAWRDKDRMHLRDLASVGLIDETWPAKFDAPLGDRLQHIIDTPEG